MRLGGTKGRCTARRELLEPGDLNVVPNSFLGISRGRVIVTA